MPSLKLRQVNSACITFHRIGLQHNFIFNPVIPAKLEDVNSNPPLITYYSRKIEAQREPAFVGRQAGIP